MDICDDYKMKMFDFISFIVLSLYLIPLEIMMFVYNCTDILSHEYLQVILNVVVILSAVPVINSIFYCKSIVKKFEESICLITLFNMTVIFIYRTNTTVIYGMCIANGVLYFILVVTYIVSYCLTRRTKYVLLNTQEDTDIVRLIF